MTIETFKEEHRRQARGVISFPTYLNAIKVIAEEQGVLDNLFSDEPEEEKGLYAPSWAACYKDDVTPEDAILGSLAAAAFGEVPVPAGKTRLPDGRYEDSKNVEDSLRARQSFLDNLGQDYRNS